VALNSRRDFLKVAASASIMALTGCAGSGARQLSATKFNSHARVVVIGGGFGGAIAAKYIKRADPSIRLTLVERNPHYITGPFTNGVITGLHDVDYITRDYRSLVENHDIDVIHDQVTAIDPDLAKVVLKSGKPLEYDRLVVSPGVDLSWTAIEHYDHAASEIMPHGWKGAAQIALLQKRLQQLDDGAIVIITVPTAPFSGPSAPYERASLIANYLSINKPRCKVLILDGNADFLNRKQFSKGWELLYPGMIEWVSAEEGGRIIRVSAVDNMVFSDGEKYKAGLINVIPPQLASSVARQSDLADDSGWCPVVQKTFESSRHANIHVIGDACIAGDMPKSGFAANSQAKVAAAAVVSYVNGQQPGSPSYLNACYSLLSADYGISQADAYRLDSAGNISRDKPPARLNYQSDAAPLDAVYADSWYANITADMFA